VILKPFRDYSEHNVINLFTMEEDSADKGCFAQMVSFNPDNYSEWDVSFPGTPNYAFSHDYRVNAIARLAPSGVGKKEVLGMLLYDVRTVLAFPFNMLATLANPAYLDEQQVAVAGFPVPILSKGIVEIGGFHGIPAPGSGALIFNSGILQVVGPNVSNSIGTFLSSTGADGCALFRINTL